MTRRTCAVSPCCVVVDAGIKVEAHEEDEEREE